MATVAVHDLFLQAYARLPKAEQNRVRRLIDDLRRVRTHAGRHMERIVEAEDENVYSVRISDAYRAILVRPPDENVLLLVWADHHDEAYRWVKRKHFEVNPRTGVLQMWSTVEAEDDIGQRRETTEEVQCAPDKVESLFAGFSDEQLLNLGLPASLLPAVRRIADLEDFEQIKGNLPVDAVEALQWLAAGEPYEAVADFMEEWRAEALEGEGSAEKGAGGGVEAEAAALGDEGLGGSTAQLVPGDGGAESATEPGAARTDSVLRAVFHPASGSQWVVITSDVQLEEILSQPLEKWRTFLHPYQRTLVEKNFPGSVRVLGGAGTGKTVVALHRARQLVRTLLPPDSRILVTTFTRNLTENLKTILQTMCTPEEMERIDVISMDRLAWKIVGQARRGQGSDEPGVPLHIVGDAEEDETAALWRDAAVQAGWPVSRVSLLQDEYRRVIQFHGVDSFEQYLNTPRTGRRTRLSRSERRQLWSAVEEFRTRMRDRGWYEFVDVQRAARQWVQAHPGVFSYRAAVVDEVQDLHPEALRLLRALVPEGPNDLFLVGDAHQRIYEQPVVLSRCGISVRGRRSRHLHINYRTTEQIRRQAMAVLKDVTMDDLDGAVDEAKDISLLSGPAPERKHFDSAREEQAFVAREIARLLEEGFLGHEIAVIARTRQMVQEWAELLGESGRPALFVERDGGGTPDGRIRCLTMHRSKGLEFRAVFLCGVNEGVVPPRVLGPRAEPRESDVSAASEEEERRQERILQERCLLYVASTRARDRLYVTSYGRPSPLWPV